jgi:hypothetical protein
MSTATIEQLEARGVEIRELLVAAANGESGNLDLNALAREAGEVKQRIGEARTEAEQIERQRQVELTHKRRARFESCLAEGLEARRQFTLAFRSACLSLGDYCVTTEEASALLGKLTVSLGGDEMTFQLPLDKNRMVELNAPIDPLGALLDDGSLEACKGFGWNLAVRVAPLVNVIQQRIRKEESEL